MLLAGYECGGLCVVRGLPSASAAGGVAPAGGDGEHLVDDVGAARRLRVAADARGHRTSYERMDNVNAELARRIWEWLPGRTDGRRVTLPVTIAGALHRPVPEVVSVLVAMEKAGHAIRDAATGRQTGWHRGTPPPQPQVAAVPVDPEWTLY